MARIFISHSSLDNETANWLKGWLDEKGFEQTFLDFDKDQGIQPGAEWEKTLYREIERAQAVVIVVTDHWLASKWCFAEFAQARALGKVIFPLIVAPTGEKIIGEDLQNIDLISDREGGLDRLGKALTQVAMQSPEGFDLPKDTVPFPGLSAFEERHAAVFYGRDPEIRKALERLRRCRTTTGEKLIVLLGASGSGKSSLLRAGLVPRLKRDRDNWIVCPPFRPEDDPQHRLIDTLLLAVHEAEVPLSEEQRAREAEWREALTEGAAETALKEIARELRRKAGAMDALIMLPIDQAEEVFTNADADEAAGFFALLNKLLDEALPFVVVAALRSDHLPDLQKAEHLSAAYDLFALDPMPLQRIGTLARGPAKLVDLKVDDEMVSALVQDAESEDALPLIAFLLRKMFEKFGADKVWTVEHYRSLGNPAEGLSPLQNIVRVAADEALPKLTSENDAALRETFIPALVRINASGAFVRRPGKLSEIETKAQSLVQKLIAARLLVTRGSETAVGENEASAGDDPAIDAPTATTIEVAHEALFRVWPRLAGWLEDERDFLIGKSRLEQYLADWQSLPDREKRKALLNGVMLERARGWLIEHPGRLSKSENDFVRWSMQAETEDRKRRERTRRNLFGALTTAVVILVVGVAATTFLLFKQNEQEDIIKMQARNAAEQLKELQRTSNRYFHKSATQEYALGNRNAAGLLALYGLPDTKGAHPEDVNRPPYILNERMVRDSLYTKNQILSVSHGEGDVISNSGRYLATKKGNQLEIFDINNNVITSSVELKSINELEEKLCIRYGVRTIFSQQEDVVAFLHDPGVVTVFDIINDAVLSILPVYKNAPAFIDKWSRCINGVAFSSDAKQIAISTNEGAILIWNLPTAGGSSPVELPPASVSAALPTKGDQLIFHNILGARSGLAFSPDDSTLVYGLGSVIRTIEVKTGVESTIYSGLESPASTFTFSPDGSRMAAGTEDGRILMFNQLTWTRDGGFQCGYDDIVGLEYLPDGVLYAVLSAGSTLSICEENSPNVNRVLGVAASDVVESAKFFNGGRNIISRNTHFVEKMPLDDAGSGEHRFAIKTVSTVWRVRPKNVSSVINSGRGLNTNIIKYSSGEKYAFLVEEKLHYIETISGHVIPSYVKIPDINTNSPVSISEDGRLFSYIDNNNNIVLSVLESGHIQSRRKFSLGSGRIGEKYSSLVFSHKGDMIAAAHSSGMVFIIDVRKAELLGAFEAHREIITGLSFGPDDEYIYSTSFDGRVVVGSLEKLDQAAVLMGPGDLGIHTDVEPQTALCLSRDGKYVASIGSGGVSIFSSRERQLLATVEISEAMMVKCVFSPNGRNIVILSDLGNANILNVSNGSVAGDLSSVDFRPADVWFLGGGDTLALVSKNGDIRLQRAAHFGQLLVDDFKASTSRCLTIDELENYSLSAMPPRWCITGVGDGVDESDPSTWVGKWPYTDDSWKRQQVIMDAKMRGNMNIE